MKKNLLIPLVMLAFTAVHAQDDSVSVTEEVDVVEIPDDPIVTNTFSTTRIINGHSVETLNKGVLEFRIEHRFGDFAGTNGGGQTLFGLDNVSDVRFALEYGVTKNFMIGVGRSKGTGNPYRALIDGFAKYRVLHQSTDGMPVSMTVLGVATCSYMKKSTDISQISYYPEWQHRLAYATQVNIARKFGNRLSLSIMPTFVYRNYVGAGDVNGLFSLGAAARINITSTKAIILEYYQNFNSDEVRISNPTTTYKNSFGIAYEWDTFGHNFTINLTNSKGFVETQFIPYTFEDWMKGQFRLGFSITRKFIKA